MRETATDLLHSSALDGVEKSSRAAEAADRIEPRWRYDENRTRPRRGKGDGVAQGERSGHVAVRIDGALLDTNEGSRPVVGAADRVEGGSEREGGQLVAWYRQGDRR